MKTSLLHQSKNILCGFSAVAIMGTIGCTYTERQQHDSLVDGGPNSVTVAQQDYVYYPAHNVYYNRGADQFRVYEGNRWVDVSTPRNVSRQRVLATESVSIAQYGSPERHYTEYVQPNMRSGSQSRTTSTRTVRY